LTLPGEQVQVRITQDKRGYSTAEPEQIVTPASNRIPPQCRHFGVCGGCHYQHTDYTSQLQFKQAILRETLERAGVQPPETISILSVDTNTPSHPWAYRNRIRLAFDANGDPGYRSRRSHSIVPIAECPIAVPLLVEAALACAEVARNHATDFRPTELALFCNADESSLLASLFIAKNTSLPFDEFAQAFHARIPALRGVELALEDSAAKHPQPPRTIARWGDSSIFYRAAGFDYRVDHGAFFQVNRWLVDALVEKVTAGQQGLLAWDLFAGVGLFARKLTSHFDHVVAVESAPSAVNALEHNLSGTTGTAVRASTLDFLRRAEKALQENENRPGLIIVDPPRTGLGHEITGCLTSIAAPNLTYVSCDPATLARDLRPLIASGHRIQSITLADLFPQTFHLETIVHLRRT
jgi:23S rRNA (uracil1939-C5)-methyltransferase